MKRNETEITRDKWMRYVLCTYIYKCSIVWDCDGNTVEKNYECICSTLCFFSSLLLFLVEWHPNWISIHQKDNGTIHICSVQHTYTFILTLLLTQKKINKLIHFVHPFIHFYFTVCVGYTRYVRTNIHFNNFNSTHI